MIGCRVICLAKGGVFPDFSNPLLFTKPNINELAISHLHSHFQPRSQSSGDYLQKALSIAYAIQLRSSTLNSLHPPSPLLSCILRLANVHTSKERKAQRK